MKTAWHVKAVDAAAGWTIAVGGIGTIVAVLFVACFLLWRVLPLFQPAFVKSENTLATAAAEAPLLRAALNEYQTLGWALYANGELRTFRADTGAELSRQALVDKPITAASFVEPGELALGFGDGSVALGAISFTSVLREPHELPEDVRQLGAGEIALWQNGIVERTNQGPLRHQTVKAEIRGTHQVAKSPVLALDHLTQPVTVLAHLAANEGLGLTTLAVKKAVVGKPKTTLTSRALPLPLNSPPPDFLRLLGVGDNLYCIWKQGRALRFDLRQPDSPVLAEELSLLDDREAELAAVDFILNQETLLCGDTRGRVHAWFRVARPESQTSDKWVTTLVHRLPPGTAAVTCFGSSVQRRLTAAGYADGSVQLFHVTTAHSVLRAHTGGSEPLDSIQITPKDDGLLASAGPRLWHSKINTRHPEVTVASLSLPVWYEGYDRPKSVWQSSFAGTGPETKLGLWPLVFGTIKAAWFSMLIGAPLALLAAVYTSEFVHARWRARVKSCIEIMASLPSVVLGFLAAIVFAPVLEQHVCEFLALFLTVPLALALGAHAWLLVPHGWALRLRPVRLLAIGAAVVAGGLLALPAGPLLEGWFFEGDFMFWLNNPNLENAWGMWALLLLPWCGVGMAALVTTRINPYLRQVTHHWSRPSFSVLTTGKFFAATGVAVGVALVLGTVLAWCGLDPRGRADEPFLRDGMVLTKVVSTYVQRNALLVGFVMGFAIIPIIYTIAEDALAAVPQHLRSAALGAGATPWQAAVTVVIPTAMSGLFSALMIGLGRAVGETMIVLCAGGNTPEIHGNPFSGFRTLSANIAVELPEAVAFSTHERTLYLAALVLFVLTFFVNTVAEIIRLRFRRRAYQL